MNRVKEQIMQLSQKPECIDLMLHDDLKNDYSFRTNIQDIASLLSGILNIMQQANLTDKELAELEQLYNERYELISLDWEPVTVLHGRKVI